MNSNIVWIDILRIIGTFSVVWIHSAAPLLYKFNKISIMNWWVGNIYDSMARMCVPLFFMISGFLLLNKSEAPSVFFQKRLYKVVLPLIAWSILYILWKHYIEGKGSPSFYIFFSLVITPAYFHLWFLYAIIGIYLFMPILRIITQHSSNETLYYFVFLWFVAVSVIPFFEMLTGIKSVIDLQMISGYIGYFVLGLLLGEVKVNAKFFILSVVVFIVSVFATAFSTYYFTVERGVFVGYFYGHLTPNVIVMSISFFVFIKYLSENSSIINNAKAKKIIEPLSAASFGIYLVHAMVLYILSRGYFGLRLNAFTADAYYSIPATAISTYIVSFIIVYFLQSIPFIKKIAP
ncbi:MAG: acyltransferase family protein [Magnetococcales bacterium]|nr:acyltransferase family protein [Magnetococcales bacterium]MBF0322459.1 acyltransferase family protein [Magnetococcales bacterium]